MWGVVSDSSGRHSPKLSLSVCLLGQLPPPLPTFLRPKGNNRYIGTAGDVIGEGEIRVAGNSMFLDYILRIPYGDGTLDLHIDDRMYLVNENVLINESKMYKFGIRVGEILLVIQRLSPGTDAAEVLKP